MFKAKILDVAIYRPQALKSNTELCFESNSAGHVVKFTFTFRISQIRHFFYLILCIAVT